MGGHPSPVVHAVLRRPGRASPGIPGPRAGHCAASSPTAQGCVCVGVGGWQGTAKPNELLYLGCRGSAGSWGGMR